MCIALELQALSVFNQSAFDKKKNTQNRFIQCKLLYSVFGVWTLDKQLNLFSIVIFIYLIYSLRLSS